MNVGGNWPVADPAKERTIHLLLLAAVVMVTFGNSLFNGFVWDDNLFVVGNRVYREFDLEKMFFSLANGLEYLPLRDLTYAVDYALWGERAAGFHLVNLLFYLANVVAVYFLTLELTRYFLGGEREEEPAAPLLALFTALLFAVHPLHSEAVSFIICRNVLVSGLFFFMACRFYLKFSRSGGTGNYLAALLCFLLALLAKATTIIFPLILLLITAFNRRRNGLRTYAGTAPFFGLSAVFFFLFRAVGSQTGMIREDILSLGGVTAKVATALQIPLFYIGKLLFPMGLSAIYDLKFADTLMDVRVFAAVCLIFFLTLAAVMARRKYPQFPFSFGWFLLALIPVLNLMRTTPVVADRYAYLSSFAYCYAVAWLALILVSGKWGKWPLFAFVVVAICWSGLAIQRNSVWKDNKTLFMATIKSSPGTEVPYINLGNAYVRGGEYEQALNIYLQAERRNLAMGYSDSLRGYLQFERGDYPQALAYFNKSIENNEDLVVALYYQGVAYEQLGEKERAIGNYNKIVALKNIDDPGGKYKRDAKVRLARLLQGFAPGLEAMRQKIADHPSDVRARGELALALDSLGLYDEALEQYSTMEKSGMKDWRLFYNMANVYKKRGKYREAADYYEKSLVINPSYPDALNNLGAAYQSMHRYELAIGAFKRAMALDSGFAYAPFNLAVTYCKMGDKANALRVFKYARQAFPALAVKVDAYLEVLEKER